MGESGLTPEERVRALRREFVQRHRWMPNALEWVIGGVIALVGLSVYFVITTPPLPKTEIPTATAPASPRRVAAPAALEANALSGQERLRIVPLQRIGAVLLGNSEHDNDLNMKMAWPGMQPERRMYGALVNWYWVNGLLQAVYVNDKCIGVVARDWDFVTDQGARPLTSFSEWKNKHGNPKSVERGSGEVRAAYKGMVLTIERGKVVAVTVRPW